MNDTVNTVKEFIQDYWVSALGGVFVLCAGAILIGTNSKVENYVAQAQSMASEVRSLKKELGKEVDVTKEVEVVNENTINARATGALVIDAENKLADEYLDIASDEPLDNEKIADSIGIVKQYTGREEPANTWKRNRNWTLSLESVVNYKDDSMPVVFYMKNGVGDLMGLVRANYDGDANVFTDVDVAYTGAGMSDSEAVGGR